MNKTYSDASIFGRRKYEISDDAISVVCTGGWSANFETKFQLSILDPNYDKLSIRSPLFMPSCHLTLAGVLGTILLTEFSHTPGITAVHGFFMLLGLVGIVFGLLSMRGIPAVNFKNDAGVSLVGVFRAGPQKNRFDEFIEYLVERINESRGKASNQ